MKKFTFLAFTVFLFLGMSNLLFAQQKQVNRSTTTDRCGSMQWLNEMMREPGFKAEFDQLQEKFQQAMAQKAEQIRTNPNYRTNVTYTVPVVFHIVLANQAQATDQMIFDQLDVLNDDYSGLNADSTNATVWYSVRGHSNIQFCLAQRDPNNVATNGIERRVSGTQYTGGGSDPVKSFAAGGLDAWDPNRYLNIWVAVPQNPSLLGYATFPGGTPSQQGCVLTSGTMPGGSLVPYNLGRTATHEIGHFFNLRHIWGDAFCGDDFCADTPQHDGSTFGCPTGTQATGCSGFPNPPGRMYQNYMDYTDDACMTMFTNDQNVRQDACITSLRPGLTTSNGCTPVVLTPDNASISAIVTPTSNFSSCNATVPLTVTLRNAGSNQLTSVTIIVKRNGVTMETRPVTVNLASGGTQNFTMNAVPIVTGANTIEVCTSMPNGVPDTQPGDDCRTVAGTGGGGTALPLVEGFESVTFPPTGWLRQNPDNSITWQRTTAGVGHSGVGKAFVDHAIYGTNGQTDDLISPDKAIGQADSLWVSFWAAYKGWPGFPFEELQILVSTNCGGSYTLVKHFRNDTAFGVQPTTQAGTYIPSNLNQWRQASVELTPFIPAGTIRVMFREINRFGNNIYLDDININKAIFFNNDAGVVNILAPGSRVCVNSMAPRVTIKNFGKIALTSVKINYQIDATGPITTFNWTGNLARNQTTEVTLPVASLGSVGAHSIRVYTTEPNGVADEDVTNDSQTKAYNVYQVVDMPTLINEEFTSPVFPPAGWEVINPNGDTTWRRNPTIGRNAPGSAWVRDFRNNTGIGRFDDLAMPNFRYSGIDSIFMSFNLAHAVRTLPGSTGSRLDTFSVLLSRDCGNTFQTIYKKWGEELQTVNDPNFQGSFQEFFPNADQWRNDSINLGKFLGASENQFQLVFRFHGNWENNFFLDDVKVRTQVLPAKLKTQGYLVLPNPFNTTFGIWHYQTPSNLRYINIYNSVGQLVWARKYNGEADKFIQVDLSSRAAGLYHVTLGYDDTNRNTTIQIVKY